MFSPTISNRSVILCYQALGSAFRERKRERSREGCLSGVVTYLRGTVLQGCRLFKRCHNLPEGHCVAGVQAV